MNEGGRYSSTDLLGYVPYGTHFCHFYDNTKYLTSVPVTYFKAGLKNNEFCIWVNVGLLGKEPDPILNSIY